MPDRVDTAVERMQAPGPNTPVDLIGRQPDASSWPRLTTRAAGPPARDHAVEKLLGDLAAHIAVKSPGSRNRPGATLDPWVSPRTSSTSGALVWAPARGAASSSTWQSRPLDFAGQEYAVAGRRAPAISTSRTPRRATRSGSATRRASTAPACAASSPPGRPFASTPVMDRPSGGDELDSPYLEEEQLDLKAGPGTRWRWRCRPRSSAGTSARGSARSAGRTSNTAGPEHRHEREPDPRWAALRELKLD